VEHETNIGSSLGWFFLLFYVCLVGLPNKPTAFFGYVA